MDAATIAKRQSDSRETIVLGRRSVKAADEARIANAEPALAGFGKDFLKARRIARKQPPHASAAQAGPIRSKRARVRGNVAKDFSSRSYTVSPPCGVNRLSRTASSERWFAYRRLGFAVWSNSRLVAVFNLPLAVVTGWLLWRSLEWPLVGDATIFHFIAGQMKMGAVPYRDIVDINMPLTYGIHAAVVAIGGMSDVTWRAFDLTAAAVMSALILMLVGPAGPAVSILAVLAVLVTHLLLGPYAAGQRDFLMSIPAVATALVSARIAEDREHRWLYLLLAGAFGMTAASIKPSGMLLLFLPALATGLRWREMIWIIVGAAGVGLLVFGTLAAWGGLDAFITMIRELLPQYASMGARSVPETLEAVQWIVPIAGLAIAAALSIAAPKPPRVRAMIGLTLFGLIHLLVQRKGWSYHVYPLGIGLACWGAWSLATLPEWGVFVCLIVMASTLSWLVPDSVYRLYNHAPLRAASAMQSALVSHLPHGARVQVLDADSGAFLAMARAGMRQATPHIQWFSLLLAKDSVRWNFLAALEADPPPAILLTNDQWPQGQGFEAADNWPEFTSLLTSHYDLNLTGHEDYISWRLYLRRASPSNAQIR